MRLARAGVGAAALALVLSACQDDPVRPEEESLTPPTADARFLRRLKKKTFFTLEILHNNDGESELLGDGQFGGIARFAQTVADLKEEATEGCRDFRRPVDRRAPLCDVLLVSSGDNILAGPEFSASLDNGPPFFDSEALDRIGYDAIALGNHEFDFGTAVLADFVGGFWRSRAPFLSANLDFGPDGNLSSLAARRRLAASRVVWLKGMRVGVIGATTPELRSISSPGDVIVRQNVADDIQREVHRLQARGVKVIVLIAHLQSINEDLELIPMLDGVDVVVAGGGDELLANDPGDVIPDDVEDISGPYPIIAEDIDGTDVPVITTSGQYRYVGRLRVEFNVFGEVVRSSGGPVVVEGPEDPEILARVQEPVANAVAALQAQVIGNTEVELDGVRGNVRTRETNEGNLIADALRWQAGQAAASLGQPEPDVAVQNGGGIRNDGIVPVGDLTVFDTFDWVPFPNFVTFVPEVSRERFLDLLENAVSRVEDVNGRFAQVSGFRFTFDDGAPAGDRIVDVVLDDGTVLVENGAVVPGDALTLVTVDFLARGGDDYPLADLPRVPTTFTYQQAVQNYITDALGGTVTGADYPEGGEGRITRVP